MDPTSSPDLIDDAAFRRSLERLKQEPIDPSKGLFGPDSIFWEVNRHAIVYFLGAVQSVQMQLCHPWVATAVFAHSKIMSDPRTRARLTYVFLWSLIYGDLATVERMARGLHNVHRRIEGRLDAPAGAFPKGSAYVANEAHAMLWVHVTAFYCRVRLYDELVRRLSEGEKDAFVREAKLYAYCFGIPESIHPGSWHDVEAYVAAMQASPTLARTEAGITIRRFLERTIPWPLRGPVWNFVCVSLPSRTQELLELPTATAHNLARAARVARVARLLQRGLPASLAYVPAWHEARARIAGGAGPDRLTALLNTLYLGRSRLVS